MKGVWRESKLDEDSERCNPRVFLLPLAWVGLAVVVLMLLPNRGNGVLVTFWGNYIRLC